MEVTALSLAKTVLDGLLSQAKSAVADEVALQLGVQREMAFIKDEFEMMQTFLMAADEEQGQSKVVRAWVKQVRDLAYDVEDSLAEFALHLDNPSCMRSLCALGARRRIAADITQLKSRVEDVSQRNLRYRLIAGPSSKAATAAVGSLAALGIEEAQHGESPDEPRVDLVRLISYGEDALGVIAVWERGDVGKTSIIGEMYDHPEIGREFQCRAWVNAMHSRSRNELLRSMVQQLYASSHEASGKTKHGVVGVDVLKRMEVMGADELVEEFARHVNEKRYLIVLDDLSSVVEWNWIKLYLPDMKNGSRVVVTTREGDLASQCTGLPNRAVELKRISPDHSLYVFFKKDTLSTRIESKQPSTSAVEDASEQESQEQLRTGAMSGAAAPAGPEKLVRRSTMAVALEEARLVGREEEKGDLVKFISDSEQQLRVISVWGMGGLGKTTLVRNVYDSEELSQKFQCRAWVTVLHPFNLSEFLRNLVKQFYADGRHGRESTTFPMLRDSIQNRVQKMTDDELAKEVKQHLETRYMIVLDDLSAVTEWDSIKKYLPDKKNGSRIIVTTRSSNVAKQCAPHTDQRNVVRDLQPLAPAASRGLLLKKVYKRSDYPLSPDIVEQADLILKKCGGLPLAIVTIGSFLATLPKRASEWKKLHEHISWELQNNPHLGKIRAVLISSYDGLPYHLKSCFLYLSIFPEDHTIRRK